MEKYPAKKLHQAKLPGWVEAIIAQTVVYAPQARQGRFVYDRLSSAAELRLDHDVTILPPKKYLLPQRETLLRFTRAGGFEPAAAPEPFVLFGLHPYDVAAIAQMDRYYGQDNPDTQYLARRRQATIVACDVQNASDNVFAGCMGTATARGARLGNAPAASSQSPPPDPVDLLLTLVGDTYVIEAFSPRGTGLLALAGELEDADPVALGRREQVWQDADKLLRRHRLACRPEELPALMEKSFDSPLWQEMSDTCFSCGSCVTVCPSCFCFDVQDDADWNLEGGTRARRWDGCMLCDFALVAGGHNFRKQRDQRYRHRFFRKASYLPARCGFVGCVGCGRCILACTAKIANPVEVYNRLLEDQA